MFCGRAAAEAEIPGGADLSRQDAASRRDGGRSFVTKVQHMIVCAERADDLPIRVAPQE